MAKIEVEVNKQVRPPAVKGRDTGPVVEETIRDVQIDGLSKDARKEADGAAADAFRKGVAERRAKGQA